MMPEALYFRTYPSGKLCFISERGQLAKKQRNLVPPLTCYNDLQTRIRFFFFFHSTFPLQKGTLFLSSVVSSPHLRAPPFSSTEGSSIMPENQRWHTTPPSLKQTNPTVFTRSVFARYFLFSPTLQLGAKRVWVRWTRWISNDPTLSLPLLVEGTRTESYVYLVRSFNPRLILKFPFTRSLDSDEQPALSRPVYSQIESNSPRLSLPEWTPNGAPKILSIIYSSNFLFAGWRGKKFVIFTGDTVICNYALHALDILSSGNVINVQHFFQYLCLHPEMTRSRAIMIR